VNDRTAFPPPLLTTREVAGRLLTTREVGKWLGLSPEAVLRRWRAGELPGFRLGSNVLRFRQSELDAWLEDQRDGATVEPRLAAVGTEAHTARRE
jgi:excisionase family DNA binding protein